MRAHPANCAASRLQGRRQCACVGWCRGSLQWRSWHAGSFRQLPPSCCMRGPLRSALLQHELFVGLLKGTSAAGKGMKGPAYKRWKSAGWRDLQITQRSWMGLCALSSSWKQVRAALQGMVSDSTCDFCLDKWTTDRLPNIAKDDVMWCARGKDLSQIIAWHTTNLFTVPNCLICHLGQA